MGQKQTEPPHPDVIARLLKERHTFEPGETVVVEHSEVPHTIASCVVLATPRRRLTIDVKLMSGPKGDEGWMAVADALDALVGTYLESDRAHRTLPVGADVRFGGCIMQVQVTHEVPELSALADHILGEGKNRGV